MAKHQISPTHARLGARSVRPFVMTQVGDQAVAALARIGVHMDPSLVHEQVQKIYAGTSESMGNVAMDSAYTTPITSASIPTPLQFLQTWLPGFVKVMTSARKIDDIVGIKTVGSWEDQEIVQGIVEPAGIATEYGDYTNIPLASWNVNFERRTIVRGELGMSVALLEEGRSAKMRISSADEKRQAAGIALEMLRNAIGFYGWDNGQNRTFGFLNDPNMLPAFNSATATGWATASFQQITNDIRLMVSQLRTQSGDQIDPEKVDITMVLPTNKVDMLTTTTDFGISVRDWIKQTYPRMRVVSAPELTLGGIKAGNPIDIAYMFAESIDASIDGSSDGGEVFAQLVQTKFMTLGVEKRAKSYVEDYSNATAGVLCKRPWAVTRMVGV